MRRILNTLTFITLSIGLILFLLLLSKQLVIPDFPQKTDKTVIITNALVTFVPQKMERAKIKRVVDGDTVELQNGKKVRYLEIDTPELHHPTKPVQCFAKEAMEENKKLVEGKEVYLLKGITNTDRYQRLLRYIYLPNPKDASHEALFVNRYLVEEGFAYSYKYPPDIKYNLLFLQLEKKARENHKGLWQQCPK